MIFIKFILQTLSFIAMIYLNTSLIRRCIIILEKPLYAAFISNATLPNVNSSEYSKLISNIFEAIDTARSRGINYFLSDTGRGFNLIAPLIVLLHKIVNPEVRLCLQIPSKDRTGSWTGTQRKCFNYILENADECVYLTEKHKNGCIAANTRCMIDRSSIVIAYIKQGEHHFDAMSYSIEKNREIIIVNPDAANIAYEQIKPLYTDYN